MGYKRKAHILFVGSDDVCRAMMAAAFANKEGARWVEARAVAQYSGPLNRELIAVMREIGFTIEDQTVYPFNAANVAWADLVVTLDEAADQACPSLPPQVQKRCYPFPSPTDRATLCTVRDAIRQRVAGMVGGLRMMA